MVRLKYFLLPIAGALSAFLSFLFAAPYVKTLNRPWLKPEDPLNHFTFGTLWTNVQHAGFGILLCGSFCFILEAGRRSWAKVIQATVLGMIFGGIANSVADSGSDYIGIRSMQTMGASGQFVGSACWFILVPLALSFSITFAIGPTKQRIARALYATMIAAIFTFIGKIVGSIFALGLMMSTMNLGDIASGKATTSLEKAVPAFLVEAIFTGIALGLTMARADKNSRAGSLRLVYGRKEFRDWSLDHTANRIGSSEVEIPIRGFKGVEPVHACIFRQGNQFILDCQHAPGFVNGCPITQANLNHGDLIQLGEAQLVFYSAGAVRSIPRHSPNPPFQQPIMPQPQIHPMQSIQQVSSDQTPQPQLSIEPTYALVDIASKEYPLSKGVNSIGREAGNSICFPANSTVSRSHAQIVSDDRGFRLTDLNSANGTFLNGNKVETEVPLAIGDSISFGSATLTFRST